MTCRAAVERELIHAQLELHRHDEQSLEEAHRYLVRALVALEALRHPKDPVNQAIEAALKEAP